MGASVRGAIDLVRLGRELAALRGEAEPAPGDATFADAAIAALSGRLRLDEGCEQHGGGDRARADRAADPAARARGRRRREKPRARRPAERAAR